MRLKTFILLAVIAFAVKSNSFGQNSKKDTVRKVSWAVRIGGGINILRHDESKYDSQSYIVNTNKTNGNAFQLGIKLTTIPRKVFSISSELNYILSQNNFDYTGYLYQRNAGTYYDADYFLTSHSIQFLFMPKITIGSKRITYISFGFFGAKAFYYSSKGLLEEYTPGSGTGSFATNSNTKIYKDNEIENHLVFNIGAVANFGVDLLLKKQILSLELRLQPSLTPFITNPSLINYSALISASYTFGKTNAIIQFNTD